MLNKKYFVTALILTVTLIFAAGVNVLQGEDDDTVDGSFTTTGYNNPVEIQELAFEDSSGSAVTDSTSLTPQTTYTVALTIKDADTISDLYSLDVYFYRNDGSRSIPGMQTSSDGEELVASWGRDAEGNSDSVFSITTDSSTTTSDLSWGLANHVTPSSADESSDTFTFQFDMTVSKVAFENGDWQFGIVVEDGREVLAEGESDTTVEETLAATTNPTGDTAYIYGMNWYGEIQVDSEAEFSWNGLTPGQPFIDEDDNSFSKLSHDIFYISNGDYERSVMADNTWNLPDGVTIPGDIQQANLVNKDSLGAQEFMLKVQSPAVLGIDDASTLPTLPADETYELVETNSKTEEGGTSESYALYIKLSDSFQNADYSGQVTFKIANGSLVQ